MHRRLDVQGLRGLAVLLVVAFHAGLPVSGGFVGVDVFFVISGFVITGLLLRQWSADGRLDLRTFYARRVRRLLPALAIVVCATSIVSLFVQPLNGEQQQTAKTGLGAMLLSANLVIPRLAADYFAGGAADNPLLHTWSLSAEEQFYLAFPSLLLVGLLLGRHLHRRLTGPAIIVAGVSAASIAFLLAATYTPTLERMGVFANPFYSSLARAWEFGLGALVSLAADTFDRASTRLLLFFGITGTGAVLASSLLFSSDGRFPGIAVFVPVVGAALILTSGLGRPHALTRALSSRSLVWIGDLSYGWYLWHWPLIVFGRLLAPGAPSVPLLCGGLSLGTAYLSYRFVENPIRLAPRFGAKRLTALIVFAGGGAILTSGTLGVGARAGWGQEWALGAHLVMQRDCDSTAFDPLRCTWQTPNAVGSVLLLGDSQSWALADGLIPAAASRGYETVVGSANGCPFALASGATDPSRIGPAECVARNAAALRYALRYRPRVVVIANESVAYATGRVESWRASLSPVVRQLRGAGAGVILVNVVPRGDQDSAGISLLLRPAGDRSTSRSGQESRRRDADAADRLVAADNPGTLVFDPVDVFCDEARCATARGGLQFYSDPAHLSRSGARLLEAPLRALLQRAAAQARE